MTPLYTPENCSNAYQLNWSLSVFGASALPPPAESLEHRRAACEPDGVRILECEPTSPSVVQFFVSTRPSVPPSEIVRSIKGRWQYRIRDRYPSAFRRNYRLDTVGAANNETLDRYVDHQVSRHPMADSRINDRLVAFQFHDPRVDLAVVQSSNAGRYVNGLQVVIETNGGWSEIQTDMLQASREMNIRASAKKRWRLSRIGLLSNHIHILLGASMTESPESIALALLNNLASVHDMKPVFRFSYYVGSFGAYDRQAVRSNLRT